MLSMMWQALVRIRWCLWDRYPQEESINIIIRLVNPTFNLQWHLIQCSIQMHLVRSGSTTFRLVQLIRWVAKRIFMKNFLSRFHHQPCGCPTMMNNGNNGFPSPPMAPVSSAHFNGDIYSYPVRIFSHFSSFEFPVSDVATRTVCCQ